MAPPASSYSQLALAAAAALLLVAGLASPASAGSPWSRTIGGAASYEDVLDVVEAPDGSLVVAAVSDSFGTTTGDAWVLRLAADGSILGQSVVEDPTAGGTEAALALPDGGAILGGRRVVDIFLPFDASLLKLDAAGAVAWGHVFSTGADRLFLLDIAPAGASGLLAVGFTQVTDATPPYAWLVRVDGTGNITSQARLGSGAGETLRAVIETSDGGHAACGWAAGPGGATDAWVVKLDAAGAVTWQRTLGGIDEEEALGLVELPGGGLALAITTTSFASSGRSACVLALDALGDLAWSTVLGDSEWADAADIALTSSGDIVMAGRVFDGAAPTNDLWLVGLSPADGTLLWQRAHSGTSGDAASRIRRLTDGDLLVAGTWASGFPEQDPWFLRTDPVGDIPGCPLVRTTTAVPFEPRLTVATSTAGLTTALIGATRGTFAVSGATPTTSVRCAAAPCDLLTCDVATVSPDPACEGVSQELALQTTGGSGALSVEWDVDGDTLPDATGNPATVMLPAGVHDITATARDTCADPLPQSCVVAVQATVLPVIDPGEVSDVRAGRPPLRVSADGRLVNVEQVAAALAYDLYIDVLGSWYAPDASSGTRCHVTNWTDEGDGTVTLNAGPVTSVWMVVTASTACDEGTAGQDSWGRSRDLAPAWVRCGPSP